MPGRAGDALPGQQYELCRCGALIGTSKVRGLAEAVIPTEITANAMMVIVLNK